MSARGDGEHPRAPGIFSVREIAPELRPDFDLGHPAERRMAVRVLEREPDVAAANGSGRKDELLPYARGRIPGGNLSAKLQNQSGEESFLTSRHRKRSFVSSPRP